MNATVLLDRLQAVRQTGRGRWIARCPAHKDRSPSLSVRELDDGRVLVHDFAGCSIESILTSLGLTMSNLYPARLPGHGPTRGYTSTHSRIPAGDLLEVISEETSVVAIIGADMLARRTIAETDWTRLAIAAARIGCARDHAYEH